MKQLKIFLVVFLLGAWTTSIAQDKAAALPSNDKPLDKPVTETKKTEKKTDAVPVLTDKQGRTYRMINGRKVLVDSEGNQSLATPKATETKPAQEKTSK